MAGNNILTTLAIGAQHGHKIAFIFRTGSHLVLHPVRHSIGNSLNFLGVADNNVIHALRIARGRRIASYIQKAGDFFFSRRLGLKGAHAATHTQEFIGHLRRQHRHGHRTLLSQGCVFIIQRAHGANSYALATAHAAAVKMALGAIFAQG